MASKLQTGYECNFVSEPDDVLKCLICLAVARDPWQHVKCGRIFCQNCLNRYGKNKPCPNCRMEPPMYMEDARSQKEKGKTFCTIAILVGRERESLQYILYFN